MQLISANIKYLPFRGYLIQSMVILSFLTCMQHVYSQDLDQKISLKVKNKPLENVIRCISRAGQLHFSYSSQSIDPDMKISCRFKDVPIREVLNEVLLKNGIEWFEIEQQIVLKPLNTNADGEAISLSGLNANYTISGFIRDKHTGEALIGANVDVRGTAFGVASNSFGFYSLTLPPGTYTIVYSYLGFQHITKEIFLKSDMDLSFELEETSLGIREVVITANNAESIPGIDMLADFSFSGRTLAKLPGFAGNVDVLKALQTLPGIRSFGDGSSLFYVRGGNNDQNLMMIDGAPIYNPSHLFGFFSVFTPDAINDIKIFKGDFPARYGGRASSVIDITAREGNMKRFGFGGNVGPYASSLTLEGPFVKDKASFIVSGRLSTLNWFNNLTDNDGSFRLYFYDLNAKVNMKASGKDRFFLTFYTGKDEFNRIINSVYRTFGISWDNLAGTFRWNHVFSPKLFSNTTINLSNYSYYLYLSSNQEDYWKSSITSLTMKSDVSWYFNPKNIIRMGFSIAQHRSDPGNVYLEAPADNPGLRKVSKYRSMEYVLYLSNEQKIGKKISLNYGVRLPVWQNIGPTTIYYFDVNHVVIDTHNVGKNLYYNTFICPELRVSASYALSGRSSLKASYNRTTQFMQLLSNATGPFTSLEVWVPAGPNVKPLKADQVTAGYFLNLLSDRLKFSAEAFYKHFMDHMDYADHTDLLYNPLIESELRFGKSWSYGLELMLQKPSGKMSGWIGYTYSRVLVQTPEVNGGNTYPASYDSPHSICFFMSYDTQKRWSFSVNWIYFTGNPVTTPTGFYKYNGYTVPVYGNRNNERLPDYHRLDLSVAYRLNKPEGRFRHHVILTLYNAYGRENPFSVSFNKYRGDQGEYLVPSNQDGSYELVPTMISVAGIIPSINYQFKF